MDLKRRVFMKKKGRFKEKSLYEEEGSIYKEDFL